MCWEYCIDNFVLILWSWQQIMFGRELVSRWSNKKELCALSILSENHSALRGDLEGAKVLTCIVWLWIVHLRVGLGFINIWNIHLSRGLARLVIRSSRPRIQGLPECRPAKCKGGHISKRQKQLEEPFIENIRHDEQGRWGKDYSNQGSSDHVIRVVVVVADPFHTKKWPRLLCDYQNMNLVRLIQKARLIMPNWRKGRKTWRLVYD